jgi:ferric-dicitrate binding protein FerR (iron transport regulator)
MDELQLKELLEKYHLGTANAEERTLLESWYLSEAAKTGEEIRQDKLISTQQRISELITMRTGISLNKGLKKSAPTWPRIAIAASLLLMLSTGGYFFLNRKTSINQTASTKQDIAPGGNRAILTLSNGSKVNLTDAKNGNIAGQFGVAISKTAKGQIIYTATGKALADQFNIIETPNGGEYQVILPDGSHVWLNAASSLKYPVSFTGTDRKVELTGEAYFEVAHNKAKPFRVASQGQTVEVLGTHFNIMAYGEDAMKTTLLEGSVKVIKGLSSRIMKPGEQAVVTKNILVLQADVEDATAWKDGRTSFKAANIATLMRSLSRWYDVAVEYRGDIPDKTFTGSIPRNSNLSTMLKILGEMDIHAHIEGRKIIVTP